MIHNLSNAKPLILSTTKAVEALNAGGRLIFPTETFFALGCKISHIKAVKQIFLAKQRPENTPLPVIIGDSAQLSAIARLPEAAAPLLEYFWPGPLTVVLRATEYVPDIVSAGLKTIAVRISSHPLARRLALEAKEPIVATSANIHKSSPITTLAEVDPQIFPYVSGIVNKPPRPSGGAPSTIIAVQEDGSVRLLRSGAITRQELNAAIKKTRGLRLRQP